MGFDEALVPAKQIRDGKGSSQMQIHTPRRVGAAVGERFSFFRVCAFIFGISKHIRFDWHSARRDISFFPFKQREAEKGTTIIIKSKS
jgi:hypothetical protein